MESILNKSIGMYHKIMGKLSPEKSRAAILALFGMVLGTILSKFNNMATLKLSRDEQTQLKDKIKSKSTTIESNDETIKSNDETIKSNYETITSKQTEEEVNAELTSIKQENKRLESENAHYESQFAKKQKILDGLTQEIANYHDRQNNVEAAITSTEAGTARLEAEHSQKVEELKEQIESIPASASQNITHRSVLSGRTPEDVIASQNKILSDNIAVKESEQKVYSNMLENIHQCKQRADELNNSIDEIAEEKEQKQKTIEDLKKQIHALETQQTTNKGETGK